MREVRVVFDIVRSTDGTSDWRLIGELDLATAGDLSTMILPWLEARSEDRSVTFDVSELTFIDSTGVRTLYALTGPPHGHRVILAPHGSRLERPRHDRPRLSHRRSTH